MEQWKQVEILQLWIRLYHFVSKDHESCSIINCNTAYSCTNCLKVLVGGYTKNGMDWVKEILLERCKKKIVKNSYNISKM